MKNILIISLLVLLVLFVYFTFTSQSKLDEVYNEYQKTVVVYENEKVDLFNKIASIDMQNSIYSEQLRKKSEEINVIKTEAENDKKNIKEKQALLNSTREELFGQIDARDILIAAYEKQIKEQEDKITIQYNIIENYKKEVRHYIDLYKTESTIRLKCEASYKIQIDLYKKLKFQNKIIKAGGLAILIYTGVKLLGG